MEFKASVCRLVLRTTWVRLRPVLALTGIYFAFLVPSINLISDRIKLLLYDCELFVGLDSRFLSEQ